MGSALMFRAIFAMIADKADGAANGSHEERVIKGTKIALDDASKANWHLHTLLYGLTQLLMDDVRGQPTENEQVQCSGRPRARARRHPSLHRHWPLTGRGLTCAEHPSPSSVTLGIFGNTLMYLLKYNCTRSFRFGSLALVSESGAALTPAISETRTSKDHEPVSRDV
jgi:hypothetical protein